MRFCRSLLLLLVLVGVACSSKPQNAPPADAAPAVVASASATPVDVVSHASGSETVDAGMPVVAADEVDGAALRAKHRAAIKADTSAVTVLEGGTPRDLGQRLC